MVQIDLKNNAYYKWQKLSKGWWCGKGFLDNQPFSPALLEKELLACHSKAAIIQFLKKINGFFGFIWSFDDKTTLVVVDIARTFPLFWKVDGERIILSDHLNKNTGEASLWLANSCFSHSTFVPGHTTLLAGWNQLQAGELLEIKSGICYIDNWFSHQRQLNINNTGYASYQKDFKDLIQQQTQRLIRWADGRRIVIPLSGGYDSRYILAVLLKEGYTNIKAFTYGMEDSEEVNTAQKIAQQLSLDWIFVPYTAKLLDIFFTQEWDKYVELGCNMASLPHDQDFFALSYLKKQGWLEENAILCPGFCGDFQAGSYLPHQYFKFPWRKTKALQSYLLHKFVFQQNEQINKLWQYHLPKMDIQNEEHLISELENWSIKEYVSKYIVNGIRVYEFFEYDWYLPLWDTEFILFWQGVPNEFRKNMALYRDTLEQYLFEPLGLLYPEDTISKQPAFWKSVLSVTWKTHLKKYKPGKSPENENGFTYLSKAIQKKMQTNLPDSNITHNQVVGNWVDAFLKSEAK